MSRQLVSIRKVSAVEPIPGADRIELVRIDGWSVVSQKGTFKPDDLAVFHEIDAFLPLSHPAYAFLEPRAITYNGKRGARLKTVKLKNVLSQGLALPLSDFGEVRSIEGRIYLCVNL